MTFTFFIHLPKTAGTSFKLACRQALGPRLCWWVHRLPIPGSMMEIDHITDLPTILPAMGSQYDMCGGHVQFGMLPPEIRDHALLISLIREPVSRALSFFAYLWDQPQHPLARKTSGMTLYEALQVPAFRWAVHNQQCRHLFGGLGQARTILEDSSVKYLIGKTDQLADFLDALADCGGPRLVIEGSENRSRSDYREILAGQPDYHQALELLRQLNAEDSVLFDSFPTLLRSSSLQTPTPRIVDAASSTPSESPHTTAGDPTARFP